MGEALMAFDRMLDDVSAWTDGPVACERRFTSGGVEGREYDIAKAARALKLAQDAINSDDGDEQAAIKGLLDVVQAAQWHVIDEQGGFDGDETDTAGGC
jgi:hypothetical protein